VRAASPPLPRPRSRDRLPALFIVRSGANSQQHHVARRQIRLGPAVQKVESLDAAPDRLHPLRGQEPARNPETVDNRHSGAHHLPMSKNKHKARRLTTTQFDRNDDLPRVQREVIIVEEILIVKRIRRVVLANNGGARDDCRSGQRVGRGVLVQRLG